MRSAPLAMTMASWPASAANLLGAETNGRPVSSAMTAATRGSEFGVGVEAGAHCGSSRCQLVEVVEGVFDPTDVGIELGHVPGEFLAEGEGNGIHQVGAADLDDCLELLRLALKFVTQVPDRRQQPVD